MSESNGFSDEQKFFLQGFAMGTDVSRKVKGLPIVSGSGSDQPGTSLAIGGEKEISVEYLGPDAMHRQAQDQQIAAGGKLCAEEKAKREKNPLDMWDEIRQRADQGEFPKGTDVLLTKFQGMFYVAPAQDSFMCRMRFPGGAISAWQLRGIADLADRFAGGYADATTRSNLQLREISAQDPINVLMGLRDLGVIILGSGGDNIRNVTASPLSGIDPTELIETLPLARDMHHTIINHREMYGLPRKFNIAFDGGGRISALEDTNDIGFTAVRIDQANADDQFPAGIYFQLNLGGITGHLDFARFTGVLLRPEQCVPVASAIVRVFIRSGDRTDRKKARLKYVLDDWGFDKFVAEVEKELGYDLPRIDAARLDERPSDDRQGHVGVHGQKQPGLNYIGVVFPVGRMTSDQMRALSDLSQRYGTGDIRLTVWQNLIMANIPDEHVDAVLAEIEAIGLHHSATSVRAGLVACTGKAGCKYAAAHTKTHAMEIANFIEERLELDQPINIHVTGCHHSCAQHYIGDIGLISTNVEDGDDMVEGYHLVIGGGYGTRQGMARELIQSVRHDEAPHVIYSILSEYMQRRVSPEETFCEFASRTSTEALAEMTGRAVVT